MVVHNLPQGFAARSQNPANLRERRDFVPRMRQGGCHGNFNEPHAGPIAAPVPGRSHVCGRGIRRRRSPIARDCALRGSARRAADQRTHRCFHAGGAPRASVPPASERQAISAQEPAGEQRQEICGPARNRLARQALTVWRRAKPPSPLTLNHPAQAPAAPRGRGSRFCFHENDVQGVRVHSIRSLFRTDNQIVAMNHLGTPAKSQN